MSAERVMPLPPEDLIQPGREWALEQEVSGKHEQMQRYLQSLFGLELEIFKAHRDALAKEIEENGGFDKIVNEFADSAWATRWVKLKSGKGIEAVKFTSLVVSKEKLPKIENIEEAEQYYSIQILFGGLGVSAERADDTAANVHMNRIFYKDFMDPGFHPHEIGIAENVATIYGSGNNINSRYFVLRAQEWRPSIDGIDLGILKADMTFTASREYEKDGQPYTQMFPYVGKYSIEKPREAYGKLMRFGQLLSFVYKDILGKDMPEVKIERKPKLLEGSSEPADY